MGKWSYASAAAQKSQRALRYALIAERGAVVSGGRLFLAIILISGIGTLAGAFGDYTASSPSTTAKPDTTISMSEFKRIETGMTYDEVVEIVGTDGELSTSVDMFGSELKTEMYVWRGNGSIGSNANVTFQGGTVIAKSQVGLK